MSARACKYDTSADKDEGSPAISHQSLALTIRVSDSRSMSSSRSVRLSGDCVQAQMRLESRALVVGENG